MVYFMITEFICLVNYEIKMIKHQNKVLNIIEQRKNSFVKNVFKKLKKWKSAWFYRKNDKNDKILKNEK